jgi:hypothetical protein
MFYSSEGQKSEMVLTSIKSRYWQGHSPFWRFLGKSAFLPFLASKEAHIPCSWFPSNFKSTVVVQVSLTLHHSDCDSSQASDSHFHM